MSDANLWINDDDGTVVVKDGSAIHMVPLWAFEDMRDIIMAVAEKKVEVTHRDFDIQQELLDRYKDENARLRELCADVWHLFTEHGAVHPCDLPVVDAVRDRLRELGVEVTP